MKCPHPQREHAEVLVQVLKQSRQGCWLNDKTKINFILFLTLKACLAKVLWRSMTLKTCLHCLLWSDKIPTANVIVPWCYMVAWTEITIHHFGHCLTAGNKVPGLMICLPDHNKDHPNWLNLVIVQSPGLFTHHPRAQWLSPYATLVWSARGTWQSQKKLLSPSSLTQRGKRVAPGHRAEQTSSRDTLETRTAACSRFLRAGLHVWSTNFRAPQEAKPSWWLEAGQGAGPFLHLWRLLECRLILHPSKMYLSKLAGVSMTEH